MKAHYEEKRPADFTKIPKQSFGPVVAVIGVCVMIGIVFAAFCSELSLP